MKLLQQYEHLLTKTRAFYLSAESPAFAQAESETVGPIQQQKICAIDPRDRQDVSKSVVRGRLNGSRPRPLVYLAHPVRPVEGETLEGNLVLAEWCLRFFMTRAPFWDVCAPWIAELRAWGGDLEKAEAEQREEGMRRNLEIVRRCDGVVLVGPRVSSGMRAEAEASIEVGGFVADMTGGLEPWREPSDLLASIERWEP